MMRVLGGRAGQQFVEHAVMFGMAATAAIVMAPYVHSIVSGGLVGISTTVLGNGQPDQTDNSWSDSSTTLDQAGALNSTNTSMSTTSSGGSSSTFILAQAYGPELGSVETIDMSQVPPSSMSVANQTGGKTSKAGQRRSSALDAGEMNGAKARRSSLSVGVAKHTDNAKTSEALSALPEGAMNVAIARRSATSTSGEEATGQTTSDKKAADETADERPHYTVLSVKLDAKNFRLVAEIDDDGDGKADREVVGGVDDTTSARRGRLHVVKVGDDGTVFEGKVDGMPAGKAAKLFEADGGQIGDKLAMLSDNQYVDYDQDGLPDLIRGTDVDGNKVNVSVRWYKFQPTPEAEQGYASLPSIRVQKSSVITYEEIRAAGKHAQEFLDMIIHGQWPVWNRANSKATSSKDHPFNPLFGKDEVVKETKPNHQESIRPPAVGSGVPVRPYDPTTQQTHR